jgi:hypothetical protein
MADFTNPSLETLVICRTVTAFTILSPGPQASPPPGGTFHYESFRDCNHAYPVAFPKQVAIVASEATRENLRTLGGARLKDQLASTPGQIAALEAELAKATDAAARARGVRAPR